MNPELLGPLTRMAYYKIREGMATLDQFIIHVKQAWNKTDLTPEELELVDEAWQKGKADVESGVKYADEVDDVQKNGNLAGGVFGES
jgi:hypothetical protein